MLYAFGFFVQGTVMHGNEGFCCYDVRSIWREAAAVYDAAIRNCSTCLSCKLETLLLFADLPPGKNGTRLPGLDKGGVAVCFSLAELSGLAQKRVET